MRGAPGGPVTLYVMDRARPGETGSPTRRDAPTRTWPATVRLVIAGVGCAFSCYHVIRQPLERDTRPDWVLGWLLACLVFGLCALLAFAGRAPGHKVAAGVILLGTIGCQFAAFATPPVTSTDAYHYVWDGRVSLSGVSPYRYVPGDDALAKLRDPILFPGLGPDDESGITTVWPLGPKTAAKLWKNEKWTVLSRPGVPTIYPPAAQAWFAGLAALTPWPEGTYGVQVGAAVIAVAVTALLLWLLRRLGYDLRWAILWGFSPMVAVEATANGHVDVLAALFVVAACAAAALLPGLKGPAWAGAMMAMAVLTKIFPIVLAPAFLALRPGRPHPRRDVRGALVFGGSLVAVVTAWYLPHALAVGSRVIGYLPGYFGDQGYADTGRGIRRFGVLDVLGVPQWGLWPLAILIVVATAAGVWWFADPHRPWETAVWLLGIAFLLATPSYPWYMLVHVPLICLARRPEWLAVPVAAGAGYVLYPDLETGRVVWTLAAGVIAAVSLARLAIDRHERHAEQDDRPAAGDAALLRSEA